MRMKMANETENSIKHKMKMPRPPTGKFLRLAAEFTLAIGVISCGGQPGIPGPNSQGSESVRGLTTKPVLTCKGVDALRRTVKVELLKRDNDYILSGIVNNDKMKDQAALLGTFADVIAYIAGKPSQNWIRAISKDASTMWLTTNSKLDKVSCQRESGPFSDPFCVGEGASRKCLK